MKTWCDEIHKLKSLIDVKHIPWGTHLSIYPMRKMTALQPRSGYALERKQNKNKPRCQMLFCAPFHLPFYG